MLKYLLPVICILSSSLMASVQTQPGQFGVTAEYLYLKPSLDDTYFVIDAINDNDILVGKEINNKFGYTSGFRVGVDYAFCECEGGVGLFYTNLNATHKKAVVGDYLSPTIGLETWISSQSPYAGAAYSKVSADYQRVDGLYTHPIYNCGCFSARAVVGLEYADIDNHQTIFYEPTDQVESYAGVVKIKSTTKAIGPEIGFDFDYSFGQLSDCIPGELNLNVFSTASLLVGNSKTKTNLTYSLDEILYPYDISSDKVTRLIPAFHVRVALDYSFCLCETQATLGIGYEFNSYVKSQLNNDIASYYGYTGISNAKYSDYGLQGLFATFALSF